MKPPGEILKADSADIRLANLLIWIHGYQFPEASDYWDGNWLRATARCSSSGAEVEVSGSFLHLPELLGWMKDCKSLYETLQGSANLGGIEPELQVALQAIRSGKIQMSVNITPDVLTQSHSFKFEIDQSYLPGFLNNCENILQKFPLRAAENLHG
jgi:hypothetical protein